MKKIYLTITLVICFTFSKAQTFNANLANMLNDTLNTYFTMLGNIKGMSAAVYIPGQGLWQGTAGVSYAGVPITKDMKFGIASNSKLFASTVMLMLQEDGLLDLDNPISMYLPTYTNVNPTITIRQLLNHTSGVTDPIFVSPWKDTIAAHPTRVFTPTEVISWLTPPTFAPGAGWNYSNVNYILAGMIAKNVTGFHISKLIRDSILTPLNMDSTFYDVEEAETGIVSHRWFNSIDYNDTSRVGLNTAGGCAGSIFSTSSEMAQWYHALLSGQLINAASLSELTTFVGTGNPLSQYGLGFERPTTQGIKYWGHGGSTWGYRSKMIYDTCMGTVVCGLSNSWPSGQDGVTFLLYKVVLNHVPHCAGALSGITTVCQNTNGVTYTVPAIVNATSYVWTLPSGVTGVSATNTITVNFGPTAASGIIMVSGVNNFGAGGNASLAITVNPTPATPVVTQNVNVLTSSTAAGNQWYNSSGVLVGQTNQTYSVTSNSNYYSVVTIAGCSSAPSNTIQITTMGIAENQNASSLNVYPNPSDKHTAVELQLNSKSDVQIYLFDALGEQIEVIEEKRLDKGTYNYTISENAKGIYFLRTVINGVVNTKKIIRE